MSSSPSIKFASFIVKKFKSQMIESLSEPVDLSKKKALISSRFSSKGYYNSISFHRKLLLEKIKDKEIFIKGLLTHKKYIEECNSVSGILSPFGWGEICHRDKPTITRIIDSLENKSLVVRVSDQIDHRIKRVVLTKSGKQLFYDVLPIMEKTREEVRGKIPEEEIEIFKNVLSKIIKNLNS